METVRLDATIPTAAAPVRLITQLPDPGRLWIRFAPRAWPGPELPWTDLAGARLGVSRPGFEARVDRALDDLLYLPPVTAELEGQRLDTASRRLAEGTPVLVQMVAGAEKPEIVTVADGPIASAALVFDLLPVLLDGDLSPLARLVAGSSVVWPLISGVTDDPTLWRRGCERLAECGVTVAQAQALGLSPADRRRLASDRDGAFDALFHGPSPSERAFAVVAAGYGLAPFLPRPVPRPPLSGAANRALAGALTLTADLWLRLGRSAGRGLALARAAHWVDGSAYDVRALAREKNLGVVPEIDEGSRLLIEEWAKTGHLSLLRELEAEYTTEPAPTSDS